jgi:hypothetical protein
MRDSSPTPLTGPVLVFERAGDGHESFFCSPCHTDFHTSDPTAAFQLFTRHLKKCRFRRKIKSAIPVPLPLNA